MPGPLLVIAVLVVAGLLNSAGADSGKAAAPLGRDTARGQTGLVNVRSILGPRSAQVGGLNLTLSTNQTTFRQGDRHVVSASASTSTAITADVYIVAITPNGGTFSLVPGAVAAGLHPFLSGISLPAGFTVAHQPVFSLELPGLPAGTYAWLAAFTVPGTLEAMSNPAEITWVFVDEPLTLIVPQPTSYANFKRIGLVPQMLPGDTIYANARAWADFFGRGEFDLFTATLTYSPQRPLAEATPSKFEFWRRSADGTYQKDSTRLDSETGCLHPRKAIVADFNGDARPDIFVACHGYDAPPFPGEANWLVLSRPDSRYSSVPVSGSVGFFHGASAADVNGDGMIDVVVTDFDTPFFLINQGDGTFVADFSRLPAALRHRPYFSVEVVDVDGDGHLDVMLGGHEWEADSATIVLRGDGTGDYSNALQIVLPPVPTEGVVLDFLVAEVNGGRYVYLTRTSGGDGTFYASRTIQRIAWPSLSSTILLSERPAQWFPWLLLYSDGGTLKLSPDAANLNVSVGP